MSPVSLVLKMMLFVALANGAVSAQNCKLSGTKAWNSELRNIVADCPTKIVAPSGNRIFEFSSDNVMSLWDKRANIKLRWDASNLEPPAMLSWAPDSGYFFINDGEGSGMSSTLRFFRVDLDRVAEDSSIERTAVNVYRRRTKCDPSKVDPNVWGFGWDDHGKNVLVLVQSTVDEPCGSPDDLITLIVRRRDGAVLETLSKEQTKARFGSKLPATIFDE